MKKSKIPDTTIEALTRNFFKESLDYGFQYEDYLKYVNTLLDYAINNKDNSISKTSNDANIEMEYKKQLVLPLSTENLFIREFDKNTDSDIIENWMKDDFGRYFLLSNTNSKHGRVDTLINSDHNHIGIITLKDNTPIGVVAFLNCDETHRKAELRKLIGAPEYRARGYGKEATRHWIRYGFNNLKIKKIYLNTIDTNIHNIKINEKMGFKVEGILRDEVILDGTSHDVLRMGLLLEEQF